MTTLRCAFAIVLIVTTSLAVHAQTIVTRGSGFRFPENVAVDGSGNIFVADDDGVKEILAAGGYVTVKTLGSGFHAPRGVAVDGSGNVFVADYLNNAVKEILAAGGYITVKTLGSGISYPRDVAVDSSGNVFVADFGNAGDGVKEILAVGGYTTVNTLGGGTNSTEGIAVDASGNVYVSDQGYGAVKEILAAGGYTAVLTLGSGFSIPSGVAVDGSGNVFVADLNNNAVKEILAAGGYTTVKTLSAAFNFPHGVAVDSSGNVFVADTDNSAVKEILAPLVTTTSVASNANPSVFGQNITFTATVTGSSPMSTVDFKDGATPLCSGISLNGTAQAACTSATLTVGLHSITAVYSGDTNNAGSTSTALSQTVNQAATNTSVSAPGPITLGQSLLVTASVAVTPPGTGTSTGTITVSDGSADCSIALPATTCSLSPSSVGGQTITAAYNGDTNFAGSSNTTSLTVNPAVTDTAVASNTSPSTFGQSVTFTATVTGVSPTGTVDFLDGATPMCSGVTLNGSAQATCASSTLSGGAQTIYVNYNGDGNNAVSSGSLMQSVGAATQSITLTAPGDIYANKGPATATATASSGLPVTLVSDTPSVCSVSGTGPFTVTLLAPGTCMLTANQAGDGNYAAASANVNIQVLAPLVPTPALDRWALLALGLLLGLIGFARMRRA